MIDATTVIRRNPRVVSRNLVDGTGAVLLHLDTTAYHGVDQIGDLIWECLDQPIRFDALISRLRDRLDDAPANLEAEIAGFLKDLKERDLVRLEAQP